MDEMIKLKEDIKWLWRFNIFLWICVLGIGVVEVPNFRDMIDRQISQMEDFNGAAMRIEQIESRYADKDSFSDVLKRVNMLSDLTEQKETGRLEAHKQ